MLRVCLEERICKSQLTLRRVKKMLTGLVNVIDGGVAGGGYYSWEVGMRVGWL